jgi:hypothetical protein
MSYEIQQCHLFGINVYSYLYVIHTVHVPIISILSNKCTT